MGKLHLAQRAHSEAESRIEEYAPQALIITSNSVLGRLIEVILEIQGVRCRQVGPGSDLNTVGQDSQIETVFFDTGLMIDNDQAAVQIREIRFHFQSRLACLIPPSRPDAKLFCLAAGADSILEKPIQPDDLYRETGKVFLSCARKISFGGS